MKRLIILFLFSYSPILLFSQSTPNRDARVEYVLNNLGVKRDVQKQLRPLLWAYLDEKKKANEAYNTMKTKLKAQIDAETITEAQAEKLLDEKFRAETAETAVKRKYAKEFRTVISAKKTYVAFDLLNDKKSKVQGKKAKDLED